MAIIQARYESTCPDCKGLITWGNLIEWTKGAKARHLKCARPDATAIVCPYCHGTQCPSCRGGVIANPTGADISYREHIDRG